MSDKGTLGEITVLSDHGVEWRIDNIFSFISKLKSYSSPAFTLMRCEWYFEIRVKAEWLSLFLFHDSTLNRGSTFYFGIKNCDGKNHKMFSNISWIFEDDGCGCGYSKFFKISELIKRKTELAPLDDLTITCTFCGNNDFDSTANTSSLSNDILDMFTSQKACDITLHVKQEKFSAHKFILMARSPVFAAMFEAQMKETSTGVVYIKDCDPKAFRDFLMYLYSGRLIEKVTSDIFELYRIADKYIVENLKSDCLIAMMGNLSVANVTDTVNLAYKFDKNELKIKSGEFFNKNYAEIFRTSEWETFMKEETKLANELLINMAKHQKK